METENDLLNLLLKSPNSESIRNFAEQLEIDHNFSFTKDRNDLQGVWELRWSSSNSPFLKYSPFIDNLQILDPLNLNGLNLLKPCLLYTSPSPRDLRASRMPSSA